VAADHDHRHRRHLDVQLLEDLDPFEPPSLQPDIEDDERRLACLDGGQGLRRVGSFTGRVALVLEDPRNQHADVGFVVDDQNIMRHG
jgi:hypothetical protein